LVRKGHLFFGLGEAGRSTSCKQQSYDGFGDNREYVLVHEKTFRLKITCKTQGAWYAPSHNPLA